MLILDRVCLQLGKLDFEFSLQAHPAQTLAILGKSGAGKSTLLSLIAGFIKPDSGQIDWDGKSIRHLPADQRPVTSLFQANNLFEHLDVGDNIGLGLDSGLRLDISQQEKLGTVLEQVGLAGFERRMPAKLSGGEQQRVALARCLLRKQPVLLLDEPFSALDQDTREEMLALTSDLIESEGLCTLLVTHNHDDAAALNARTATIGAGKLNAPIN